MSFSSRTVLTCVFGHLGTEAIQHKQKGINDFLTSGERALNNIVDKATPFVGALSYGSMAGDATKYLGAGSRAASAAIAATAGGVIGINNAETLKDEMYKRLIASHQVPISLMKRDDQIEQLRKDIALNEEFVKFLKDTSADKEEIKVAEKRMQHLPALLNQVLSIPSDPKRSRDLALEFAANHL